MEIEYKLLEKEFIDFLERQKILILATSANGRVTARSISCVHIEMNILFQTSNKSVKCHQIKQNSNVALCAANVQIEGSSHIREHPLSENSQSFIKLYKVQHPGAFKTYSHLHHNVVIEVEPSLITFWKNDNEGKPFRDFLYVTEKKAEREYYDVSQ